MDNKEYESFLYKILNLLENTENFMKRNKYIIAYNKVLGVEQKLRGLDEEKKVILGREMIKTRGAIHYLKDGRYKDASKNIRELKEQFYKIFEKVKNENNKD